MPARIKILRSRGKALEGLFFLKQDNVLIEKKRQLKKMEQNLKTLSEISGITNEAILRKLIELNVQVEVLATLSIIPLIEVAWVDGKINKKERELILKKAQSFGIRRGQIDGSLLEQWLKQRPPRGLVESWIYYMRGLCSLLSEAERQELKSDLLQRARAIAETAGGFLGLKPKISLKKEDVFLKLESAFEP